MFQTRKLKPDRSIGGWIVPLIMIALFGVSLLILGYRRGMYTLSILIWVYAVYSLYVFLRTKNLEHLALCAFQIFLGWISYQLPSYAGTSRIESSAYITAAAIGWVFFGVLIIFLLVTRRLKWRGSEVFEMAAEPVEETGNGYTTRLRPIGRVEFTWQELLSFARFCARNLIAVAYLSPRQIVLVPVRMGQEYTYLFRVGGAHPESTWISFDFEGDVAVHISQKDYLNYLEPLAFDTLCESLGHLFIEFAELHRHGEGVRIIDRMNALQMGILG
jgi:hypothetical protein